MPGFCLPRDETILVWARWRAGVRGPQLWQELQWGEIMARGGALAWTGRHVGHVWLGTYHNCLEIFANQVFSSCLL